VERAYLYTGLLRVDALIAERLERLGYSPVRLVPEAGVRTPAEDVARYAEPGALVFAAVQTLDAVAMAYRRRNPVIHVTFDIEPLPFETSEEDAVTLTVDTIRAYVKTLPGSPAIGPYKAIDAASDRLGPRDLEELVRLKVYYVRQMYSMDFEQLVEQLGDAARRGAVVVAPDSTLRRALELVAERRGIRLRTGAAPPQAADFVLVNPHELLEPLSLKSDRQALFIPVDTWENGPEDVARALESGRVKAVAATADVYTFRLDVIHAAVAAAKALYTSLRV
jgi:hypothetical protein